MEEKRNNQEQAVTIQPMNPNQSSVFLDPVKFDQVQRACRALTNSDIVPDMYRTTNKNPENKAIANCMIALDMADRIGANPLMVMQNLYIVYGKPSWSSAFLIANVNACGRFKPLKYKIAEDGHIKETLKIYKKDGSMYAKDIDMPNYTCYAYSSEKGSNEELVGTTISIKMAKDEGWLTKDGSKWLTMPQQMLIYRAASFWVNTYAPELKMGIRTVEENEDIQDVEILETKINQPRQVVDIEIKEEETPTPQVEEKKEVKKPKNDKKEAQEKVVDDEGCGY